MGLLWLVGAAFVIALLLPRGREWWAVPMCVVVLGVIVLIWDGLSGPSNSDSAGVLPIVLLLGVAGASLGTALGWLFKKWRATRQRNNHPP